MSNQPEINSFDQYHWRNERRIISSRIQDFCQSNDVAFISGDTTLENSGKENNVFL